MSLRKLFVSAILVLIIAVLPAFCFAKLNFEMFIADEAFLLSPDVKAHINHFLLDLQQKTGTDFAIVTLPSLKGRTIEETSLAIAREAGLGNDNNGALMLVAPYEKKMRIDVGYNLEGILPDGKLGQIRDKEILPYFEESKFEEGILRGSYVIASTIAKAYGTTLSANLEAIPEQETRAENYILDFLFLIFLFLMFRKGIIFLPLFFGSVPTGSGFGGFGGSGGFGGGGISGRWR